MTTTVLFIAEHGDSACTLYRATIPAKGLTNLGYNVQTSVCLVERADHRLAGLSKAGKLMAAPDIVIARRMNGPNHRYISCALMFQAAQARGQRVYVDIDDDPWNLPASNPAAFSMTTVELAQWYTDMETADGVICSTDALAESVRKNTKQTNVFVCRSGIDTKPYMLPQYTERKPFRLGWLGTPDYRGGDLAHIADALRTALQGKRGVVELWHLGSQPHEPVTVADILSPFPVDIVTRPWVPISDLPRSLAEIDAAVVPMAPTLFNESRSVTTGLALMAAGVPFAVSSTAEYRRLWRQGAGYLVNDDLLKWPNGWMGAVGMLTESAYVNTRNDLRTAGLQLANSYYTPTNIARQYRQVFDG